MTTLTAMRGYPGSGKSTLARTLPGAVVGRDYLRKALFDKYRLHKDGEEAITVAQQAMVRALLTAGVPVVIDDMNVDPRYLRGWAKLARELNVEFVVHDVPTSMETCIARDYSTERLSEGKTVGRPVIEKIAKKFPIAKWPTVTLKAKPTAEIVPYVPNPDMPPAVILDVDGTVAHHGPNGRSPYDYSRVSEDVVDETIRDLVNREAKQGTLIVVCSGRDNSCRNDTQEWLFDNGVTHDVLLMRPDEAKDANGNKLADYLIKYDLFNEHIRNRYNVLYCLDDRRQVIDMYRALGLKVLDVAGNNF